MAAHMNVSEVRQGEGQKLDWPPRSEAGLQAHPGPKALQCGLSPSTAQAQTDLPGVMSELLSTNVCWMGCHLSPPTSFGSLAASSAAAADRVTSLGAAA